MAIDCINDRIMSFVKCLDPDPSAENRKTIVMDIVMVNINAAMLFKKTQDENWTSPWSTTTTDVLKILDLELNKVSFEVSLRLYKPRPFDRNNMWNQLRVQNKFTDVILQPSSGDPLPAHKAVMLIILDLLMMN
jgi:hypothetical protein